MISVSGIGGFFFRAREPEALRHWYADNLGVTMAPQYYEAPVWRQAAGATVFNPFDQDTKYFGDDAKQWMINFRTTDLDGIVAQLRANGNEVDVDTEAYPNGRFARLEDPEGNPIQLWEPGGVTAD